MEIGLMQTKCRKMTGVDPGLHYTLQRNPYYSNENKVHGHEGRWSLVVMLRPLMAFHFCRFLNITFASLGMRVEPT